MMYPCPFTNYTSVLSAGEKEWVLGSLTLNKFGLLYWLRNAEDISLRKILTFY